MKQPPTKAPARWAIVLLASLVVGGCADKPEEREPQPTPRAAPSTTPDARPRPGPPPAAPSAPVPPLPDPETAKTPVARSPAAVPQVEKPVPQAVKPEPTRPKEPTPTPTAQTTPQKPATAEPKRLSARDVVVLSGAPLGAVRLEHKLHAERAGNTCEGCHHPSRPEKAATAPQQACSTCHTKVASPPMKTNYQGAFHNPKGQSGTCLDCHRAENAKGKKAPMKCTECHRKG